MLRNLLLGVAALSIVGGVAYAEDAATNGSPDMQQVAQADDNNDAPPPAGNGDDQQAGNNGGGWWQWHQRWHGGQNGQGGQGGGDRWGMGQGGAGGPGMHGPGPGPGMRGPGGPGMMMGMMGPHNGFKLHLGKGIDVAVACGKEAIKDCVADAQPLIDAAKAAATAQANAPAAK